MPATNTGAPAPPRVLVTGATGGLGRALAGLYARKGARLLLWGRDSVRLEALAGECRAAGAPEVAIRALDLEDHAAAAAAFAADDDAAPLDIAVLNAGLSDIRAPEATAEDPARVAALGLVNYVTPSVLATAAAARMIPRGRGDIALIGSVAAFHDLPFGTAYSGSKAGLARFAGALGLHARKRGVGVLLVSPGFIDTPMSRRLDGARPFLVSAERAAVLIARAIERRRRHVVFPRVFSLVRLIDACAPYALRAFVLGRVKVRQSS